MRLITDYGNGIEIWHERRYDEFYVYGVTRDPYICPSEGMAHEVAASAL